MINFNDLPQEIIRNTFLNFKITKLRKLKIICSYWFITIEDIINSLLNIEIEELEVTNERVQNALHIYRFWLGEYTFELHNSKTNLLGKIQDQEFINKKVDFFKSIGSCYLGKDVSRKIYYTERTFNYTEILNKIKGDAEDCMYNYSWNYDLYDDDSNEAVWRTIIAITGSDMSLEQFKNKPFEDKFIQNFMKKYKWYYFVNQESTAKYLDRYIGIITIYPDDKTFSLLYGIHY